MTGGGNEGLKSWWETGNWTLDILHNMHTLPIGMM